MGYIFYMCSTADLDANVQVLLDYSEYFHQLSCIGLFTASLIPRPSHHPVFDHLQYAKTKGGGLHTASNQKLGGGKACMGTRLHSTSCTQITLCMHNHKYQYAMILCTKLLLTTDLAHSHAVHSKISLKV